MLHFLDDKNLVDGEREELNKILFQPSFDRSQCEFPFDVNVPKEAQIGRNATLNGDSSNNVNLTEPSSSSTYYQPKSTNLPVFLPNVSVASTSAHHGNSSVHNVNQQTTSNVFLQHGNVPKPNIHRPNYVAPHPISPYYIGLTYASPQYIVPTIRNSAPVAAFASPVVYCAVPTPAATPIKYATPEKSTNFDMNSAENDKNNDDNLSREPICENIEELRSKFVPNENNLHDPTQKIERCLPKPSDKTLLISDQSEQRKNADEKNCDKDEIKPKMSSPAVNSKSVSPEKIILKEENEQKLTPNEEISNSNSLKTKPKETKLINNEISDETSNSDVVCDKKSEDIIGQIESACESTIPTKSWASLFKNSTTANKAIVISKPVDDEPSSNGSTAVKPEDQAQEVSKITAIASVNGFDVVQTTADHDPEALKLGIYLKSCSLIHRGPAFQLRGLVNKENWCYVNATLQALLVCPPFVHLLRQMKFMSVRSPSSTPMIDSLVKFVGEFAEKFARKNAQDLDKGASFEPTYVYNVLKIVRRESFRGRQEDAEEFLSVVLNRLHDEMSACLALVDKSNAVEAREIAQINKNDDDEWQQVGPNRKTAVTRTSKLSTTPVSEIFSGLLRNATQHLGSKETVNLESFFTLGLNIQSSDITSVSSAFQQMNKEIFKSTSAKNKEIDTTRRTTFHELPCVLVLHLKFFVYTDEGVKKIVKPILYGMDLQIDWNLLSPTSNAQKMDKFSRTYKLFAVVFHHGDKAEGGHYTTDVFHGGIWVNVDDSKVYPVDDSHVLGFQPSRVPYLLFYRRCDSFSDSRNGQN